MRLLSRNLSTLNHQLLPPLVTDRGCLSSDVTISRITINVRANTRMLDPTLPTAVQVCSVLIYNPATDKLNLFNDDDFLFKRRFLKRGEHWQQSFDRWKGHLVT